MNKNQFKQLASEFGIQTAYCGKKKVMYLKHGRRKGVIDIYNNVVNMLFADFTIKLSRN